MQLAGRNVLIVGLGRSGQAAVRLAKAKGAHVAVSEKGDESKIKNAIENLGSAIDRIETGGHSPSLFRWADLVVVSPGVPLADPIFETARLGGAEIVGEVELAYRYLDCPLVGITGTNGKSTTTALIGAMLKAAGMRVFVGGNFGVPLIEALENREGYDVAVTELSSFQLESIRNLRARVATLLNAAPDHQDRYENFDRYIDAKMRLFETQLPSDAAVFNATDMQVMRRIAQIKSRLFTFGRPGGNAWIEDGKLRLAGDFGNGEIDLSDFRLPGEHNRQNLEAAALVSVLAGADVEAIGLAIGTFAGLKHRLEPLGEIKGVQYFNDSKATTLDSVTTALAAMSRPVILILGGRDKGADWRNLIAPMKGKVRAVVAYGEAAEKIAANLEGTAIKIVVPFLQALEESANLAQPGDAVLLSPGCASYDQFNNFEERGDAMRTWVNER